MCLLTHLSMRQCSFKHLTRSTSIAFWLLSENRRFSGSHRSSIRSKLGQLFAIQSINWSTCMFTPNLSRVPIIIILWRENWDRFSSLLILYRITVFVRDWTHFALVKTGNIDCHSWSVICGIPDREMPNSWWPCLERNLCNASSVRLSELSKSKAIKFLGLPFSMYAFKTCKKQK